MKKRGKFKSRRKLPGAMDRPKDDDKWGGKKKKKGRK